MPDDDADAEQAAHIKAIYGHLNEARKATQDAHSYMDDIESRLSQMKGGPPIPRRRPGYAPSGNGSATGSAATDLGK